MQFPVIILSVLGVFTFKPILSSPIELTYDHYVSPDGSQTFFFNSRFSTATSFATPYASMPALDLTAMYELTLPSNVANGDQATSVTQIVLATTPTGASVVDHIATAMNLASTSFGSTSATTSGQSQAVSGVSGLLTTTTDAVSTVSSPTATTGDTVTGN